MDPQRPRRAGPSPRRSLRAPQDDRLRAPHVGAWSLSWSDRSGDADAGAGRCAAGEDGPHDDPREDGRRAGDLLDRNFTAPAPNRVWVTDFAYVRTWAGFVYVAFILDVYAQRIVAWHASTSKVTDLVMTPLRMAIWQRDHEGRPVEASELIHHSDAGSQGGFNRSSQHLDFGGVRGWRRATGARRPAMRRRGFVGSGVLIGR
ncbi:DDE-type integrase/transposase/recombinase [Nocardioides sp. dk4132]|nr:DDE-type integrase/transposase/recombinase [Nocardioides sp. dk4132]QGA08100.1 DDE-type integrase/transposase/recombinase [Nocardioides sp. dk884]